MSVLDRHYLHSHSRLQILSQRFLSYLAVYFFLFPFSVSFFKIYFRLFECSKTSSEGCIPSVPHLWHKELICSSDLLLW